MILAMLFLAMIVLVAILVASQVVVQHRRSEQYRKERTVAWYAAEGCVAYAMNILLADTDGNYTISDYDMSSAGLLNTKLTISGWSGSRKTIQCRTTYAQ